MTFPFLHKIAPSFKIEPVLFSTFKSIIQSRRERNHHFQNVENNNSKSCGDLGDLLANLMDDLQTPEFKRLGITENTLLAQALNVTALDMISATMTMILYYLAENPAIQRKLHQELDSIIDGKFEGRIDSETINHLPYLNACLDETLRLAPPLIRPERCCTKDWSSENGNLKIRKGTVVMVPLWAAHRNPRYFADPDCFKPERWIGENQEIRHPYAYTPFGVGPRNCIGMRLAMETLRINACVLLREFCVEKRPDTELRFKPGMLFLLQFKPLMLDFVNRRLLKKNM